MKVTFSLLLLLAGCATQAGPPAAADVVVAPLPKVYTCAQEATVTASWIALPADVQAWLADYHQERIALNVLQGKAGAPACVKP